AVLFVLIGLEMIVLTFTGQWLLAAALLIPIVLAVRFVCVGIPVGLMRGVFRVEFAPHAVKILTWGGLRGGISVALALALPQGPEREVLVTVTYVIVLFSILVQGLTIGRLIRATVRE
ncbi:MAG: cation:proton antiporter, partial [Pseudomonadota bacterium]|nr:cation:proton antiporter [Pseudomonadota bacterium]